MRLECHGLVKRFSEPRAMSVIALDQVSLAVTDGETVGVVGESGSGKSTLARCIVRLERPDEGRVFFDGVDVHAARGQALRRFRREVQMVFQDPYASLNPRMTVEELVGEGLLIHGIEGDARRRRDMVAQTLARVGLDPGAMARHPRAFSGGQRQRIAIARAIAIGPRLLICDEPVSALDVSVQAQVVNLLAQTSRDLGLAILFIAHDLAVVSHLCTCVHIMHHGRVVESGPTDVVFDTPREAYTRELLAAVPMPDPTQRRRRHPQEQDS